LKKIVLFREKEPKSFFMALRPIAVEIVLTRLDPRKLCCAASLARGGTTHNDFLTRSKICNLLLQSIDTSFAQAYCDYY